MKFFGFLILMFGILLTSCNDEIPVIVQEYPRIKTLPVTNIGSTTATFNFEVLIEGEEPITSAYFTMRDVSGGIIYQIDVPESELSNIIISADVRENLEPNQKYNVIPYVRTNSYFITGDTMSFTTN